MKDPDKPGASRPGLSPSPEPGTTRSREATGLVLACLNLVSRGETIVGRAGLVRLLLGQQTALGTRAANPYKGSLAGKLKTREVESLISQLVKDRLIEERPATRLAGGTYQALKITLAGLDWLEANLGQAASDETS